MKTKLHLLALVPFILTLGCVDSPTTGTTPAAKSKSASRQVKIEFLEFHADWCGPCRQQKPIVLGLQAKYKQVTFRILDVDDDANLALVKKHQVTSIPRLIILVDDKVEADYLGLQTEEELIRGLDKAVATANRLRAP